MIMMIRQTSLPTIKVLLALFVGATHIWPVWVAPLYPAYLYDQSGRHGGYEGSSGSAYGDVYMGGGYQPGMHYQETGSSGHYPNIAPPVQYEWRDIGPMIHSDGDDYADEESRTWPVMYGGNKNGGGYNSYEGNGRGHRGGRQLHDLYSGYPQVSSPMFTDYLPSGGGRAIKYFNDYEQPSSDQHYNNPIEHTQENVPITILFKTASTPFNQHQQQHIFDLDGHYEGSNDGHTPQLIHRVSKPVITEIHEIITPLSKGHEQGMNIQVKDDYHMRPPATIGHYHHPQSSQKYVPSSPAHHYTAVSQPTGKTPHSNNKQHSSNDASPFYSHLLPARHNGYSLMKDRNSHNFGVFNKAYDLALNMNKANGYVLNGGGGGHGPSGNIISSHPSSIQGHGEMTGGPDMDEPETDSSNHEESSIINSPNAAGGGGGGGNSSNNNSNNSNLQPQQA